MPVTGNFAGLERKIASLRKIGDGKAALNKSLAEEALGLVAEGFESGSDPYGRAWGAPNNLQITGRLRAYAARADAGGFTVHSTDKKSIWHHAPRKRKAWGKALPTRLQVPTQARGLPSKWEKAFEATAREWLRRRLG